MCADGCTCVDAAVFVGGFVRLCAWFVATDVAVHQEPHTEGGSRAHRDKSKSLESVTVDC